MAAVGRKIKSRIVRRQLKKLDMTLGDLARQLDCDRATITHVLAHRELVSLDRALKWAKAIELELDDLVDM